MLILTNKSRAVAGLILLIAACLYNHFLYKDLSKITTPLTGKGYFVIQSVSPYQTPFKSGSIYKGKFLSFASLRNLPCNIYWFSSDRPKADRDYLIEGTLLPTQGSNILKINENQQWTAVKGTFSSAEWRYTWKEKTRKFLKRHMRSSETIHFISALITGDLYSRYLRFGFQTLGLSHILVISGFHFAFLTLFAGLFFRLFFPSEKVHYILLVVTTLYFFLLGPTPSIQRAWIAIELYLIAKILGKRAFSTQLLGLALFIELILNPLSLQNIGFQLSYLSCLGILLLFEPIDQFFQRLFPKRTKEEVIQLTFPSQAGFILGTFLRKSLSLSAAVNLAILPVLLLHFHKFPLLSLAYNLFFPFLITLDMALMAISFLVFPLFPYSMKILESFTTSLLNLVFYAPKSMQYYFYYNDLSAEIVVLYLCALFLLAVGLKRKEL